MQRACLANVDAIARHDIPGHSTFNDDVLGLNLGVNVPVRTDGETVPFELDRAFDLTVDVKVFGAGDRPLDAQRFADGCLASARCGRTGSRRRRTRYGSRRRRVWAARRRSRLGWSLFVFTSPHGSSLIFGEY